MYQCGGSNKFGPILDDRKHLHQSWGIKNISPLINGSLNINYKIYHMHKQFEGNHTLLGVSNQESIISIQNISPDYTKLY